MLELSCSPLAALRLRLTAAAQRITGSGIAFSGRYRAWQDALAASTGYDAGEILEKVATATSKVVRGEAAYERDSITFAEPEYPFPVVASLLRAALENGDRHLSVLDFGGSLGTTYHQCLPFFPQACKIDWHVVEQEHFVARGKSDFATDSLHFCSSAAEAAVHSRPDVILASGVLQYLETPHQSLRALTSIGSRYLLVDRTPFRAAAEDRLTVQRVPGWIYSASYPCWVFSHRGFVSSLSESWVIVAQFPSVDGWSVAGGECFRFGGMLLARKS